MFRNSLNLRLAANIFNCLTVSLANITSKMNASTLASGKVLLSKRDQVLTFTFNNEKVKNATDFEIYDAIGNELNRVAKDESVKMVVFTGTGEFYSSGINLKSFVPMFASNDRPTLAAKSVKSVQFIVDAFIDFPKPIIAAVNGPALGIQVTTLALKDYIVCADTTFFQTPFSTIGVTAEGCSSALFPEIFGLSKANSMLMFSQRMSAAEAANCGFVDKVIPKADFDKQVEEMIYGKSGILQSYSYPSILAVKSLTRNEEWRRKMHAVNEAECQALLKLWCEPSFEGRIMGFFNKKSKQ